MYEDYDYDCDVCSIYNGLIKPNESHTAARASMKKKTGVKEIMKTIIRVILTILFIPHTYFFMWYYTEGIHYQDWYRPINLAWFVILLSVHLGYAISPIMSDGSGKNKKRRK
jgi:hypothetical protein